MSELSYTFQDLRKKNYKTLQAVNNVNLGNDLSVQVKVTKNDKGTYFNIQGDTWNADKGRWDHGITGNGRMRIIEATKNAYDSMLESK